METDNLLVFVAIVAVVFSMAGTLITYNSISNFRNFVTGFAVEDGFVNVTVQTAALIEIISAGGAAGDKNITWGSGTVNVTQGYNYSILATNGTVYGGSWLPISGGFIVRNIGNVNVSLNISSNPVAAAFIGGTEPQFQYNITDYEPNSCASFPVSTEGIYKEFTSSTQAICNKFLYYNSTDEVRIDVLLKIPSDSYTGTRSSTVTLTYEVAE